MHALAVLGGDDGQIIDGGTARWLGLPADGGERVAEREAHGDRARAPEQVVVGRIAIDLFEVEAVDFVGARAERDSEEHAGAGEAERVRGG